MDAHSFRTQQKSFTYLGYAADPSASTSSSLALVGDVSAALANDFVTTDQVRPTKAAKKAAKRKRAARGDADVVDGEGAYEGPWAGYKLDDDEDVEETEEDKESWRAEKKKRETEVEKAAERRKTAGEEKSVFHGASGSRARALPCSPCVATDAFLPRSPSPRQEPHGLRRPDVHARPD